MRSPQTLVGIGVVVVGALLVAGAVGIRSEAGYSGVGPNFLPWLVAVALLLCGALLLREALAGGFRDLEEPSGGERGDWVGFAWVTAGILANALLITTIGFILSCSLLFVLAVQGFHHSQGRTGFDLRGVLVDALIGIAISAPVYWMFTKLLAINLPGLTGTGWI